MRRAQNLPELLAPAGDMQALYAAVRGGADAIYVGGRRFGARAFAKNFDSDELIHAVKYCHAHGVRLYVTLNTLIFDKELDDALEYARFLSGIGVDALIVADLGIAALIRERIPSLELHASTQMGVHNSEGAEAAYRIGCSRVVLARECSADNIKKIVDRSRAECEVFVHGALCVCHSGQCLFSSLVGGRSGNRGECAQPCRLPYGNSYPLSLKDLSLSNHIEELIESGVSSLKIEGRMKSADYVYTVTSIYRRLLDEHRSARRDEERELEKIFSRSGFTDGYFTGKTENGMTGVRSEAEKKISREISGATFEKQRIAVSINAVIRRGERSGLTISAWLPSRWDGEREYRRISCSALGAVPDEAINAPLTAEGVALRLSKLGNTLFDARREDVEITLDDGVIMPVSALNELRRAAAEGLESELLKPIRSVILPLHEWGENSGDRLNLRRTAQFFLPSAFEDLISSGDSASEFDICFLPLYAYGKLSENARARAKGVYVPPVIMENELAALKNELASAVRCGAEYALVGNIGHIAPVIECGLIPVGDIRMNVANCMTKSLLSKMGVRAFILSPELTLPMARDIGGGVVGCGRIPLMITERCFIKANFGCEKCSRASLTDRLGKKFPLMREHMHRNVIFNSVITYMGDKSEELSRNGIKHTHFVFSTEGAGQIKRLVSAYMKKEPSPVPFTRVKQKLG